MVVEVSTLVPFVKVVNEHPKRSESSKKKQPCEIGSSTYYNGSIGSLSENEGPEGQKSPKNPVNHSFCPFYQ